MKNAQLPEDYWSIVARQFRKNRIAVFGLILVIGFFVLAAMADFIAGDKPLLGATTLESLGLVLNPFKRQLVPMRLMLAKAGLCL